jgi:hypothetical protein
MEYKFKQVVSKEDYLAFYKYHLLKKFYDPIKLAMGVVFFLILLSGIFFDQMVMFYTGIGLLVFVIFVYLRISFAGGKIYDMDPESFNYDYVINEVTCSFSTKDGKSSKMWSEFVTKYENEEYLYIFTKKNRGLMFVKKSLEPEILEFINGKVSEKKKGLLKK